MLSAESAPEPSAPPAPPIAAAVGRRHLLRGGAVLAGAAGAVALSAVAAPSAQAADGDPVLQGETNDATSTTGLRIGAVDGDAGAATLSLENADGPSLQLEALPFDWDGPLAVGQIANTEIGPNIGVLDPGGFETVSYLATEFDLLALPEPVPLSPTRVVDTRSAAQRDNIIATPATNFDASGRLLGGRTMNLALALAEGDVAITAAFLNTVSVGSLAAGYLTLYPPGNRPLASSINFAKGQTIANGGFVAVDVLDGWFAFTVFTNVTCHVVVDLTGILVEQVPGPQAAGRRKGPGVRRARAAKRLPKLLGRSR